MNNKSRSEYKREWRKRNPESPRASNKKYSSKNKAKVALYRAKWALMNPEKREMASLNYRNKNRAKLSIRQKLFYRANKASIREKCNAKGRSPEVRAWRKAYYYNNHSRIRKITNLNRRIRTKTDINYAIRNRLRARLSKAIRLQGGKKSALTFELIGTDLQSLLRHIESLFLPGMTWENRKLWHIDHILPCASFDLTVPANQNKCFHYTNLQPLWELDNKRKYSKILP